jgi:hypothetical protein
VLAYLHAGHAWHADIQQDQIVAVRREIQERLLATGQRLGMPAALLEQDLRQAAIGRVIR